MKATFLRPVAATLCAAAMLSQLCSQPAGASATPLSAYSATQLFEGTLFGEGPVANLLPELWNHDTRAYLRIDKLSGTRAFAARIAAVEQRVAKIDPGFMNAFATEMTSGDPGRVEGALRHSRVVLQKMGHSQNSVLAVHPLPDTVQTTVAINDTAAAFEAVVAIAVWVAAVILVVVTVVLDQPQASMAYTHDRSIALLAARLRKKSD